ncbi:MAG: polysaccharide deacetylase family protein [Armatimonadota bacterium]|nr:polysaccharide deacetylase family protein [Armatimonadota bacterium]
MTPRTRIVASIAAMALLASLAGCPRQPEPQVGPEGEPTAIATQAPDEPVSQRSVLVLCYHDMAAGAEGTFSIPTEDFTAQLELIREGGYESVLPSQIADYLQGRADLPEKAVCLTFDDGPESILTESKPLMDQHGHTGAAFLITDEVGGKGKLSWDQVRELQATGWEIGSHTASHAKPTKIDHSRWMEELEGAKAAIEEQIDGECIALAYPYGLYDERVIEAARDAGYRMAFTIDRGPADWTTDRMLVPRQMLVNGNSLDTFAVWLDQQKLHLEDIDPAVGRRVATTTPTITATLADEAVPVDGLEISRDGNPVSYEGDAETRTITLTPELREGANNLRLNYYGSPRREVSWVIVSEPS